MSQAPTPVNPRRNPDPSPTTNTRLESDAHVNHVTASVLAKPTVLSDNSDLANTAVVSITESTAGTLKRPREEDSVEDGALVDLPEAKRRVKAAHDIIYRIVVPSRQIGKVIGRAGHRIQKIREDTQATIKIADAISKHEERVIIISSKDSDNVFSDAENALHQIVTLILKDDDGNAEAAIIGPGHVPANAVRLLIAGSQAGGLIGVSGQNIVNLRNASGASITVLSPNQLPPCASAHESDRVVQISGDIPAVLRAVVEIGCQLRDNPPKQVISISPTNNVGVHRQPQPYVDPTSGDYVTLELLVPENLVGGLIGRFGANISRIRNESGANIKVYGGRGEQTQRQIHLGGGAQQVALAKQRVDEYVYAELMRQAGGQMQLTAAGQLQQYPTQQPMPDMSNPLYHGYSHAPGLYTTSNHDVGMMSALPPMYASSATTQAPQYYANQSYPAPPL
ncbi:KH domain-containing protein At4g18375-like [Salvia hispanica]|uniref:KH domain-containing protein At4g18375-like n=1 Tax=Salvia hispanica TaxID=49212 RepID=UPI0020090ED8|nr:KH domain-containing protein At4g18375-like [Salvia hispanica]